MDDGREKVQMECKGFCLLNEFETTRMPATTKSIQFCRKAESMRESILKALLVTN